MAHNSNYAALDISTLPVRLGGIPQLINSIGPDFQNWQVQEVGDGNLNLVFIVQGSEGKVIVKQALPYVRLVGDSWPLPLYRAYFEHNALIRQAERAPGSVPEVLYYDDDQALIIMEFLEPHIILRRKLIAGEKVEGLAEFMGTFCAQTAFRGSELSMQSADKKADVAIFSANVEIPAITESLVFTEPYFDAEMNNHTPGLDPIVTKLRGDVMLKVKVQQMLQRFASNTETMLHGDLHSGSIMSTDTHSRVIDPEFAQYGPMGFDIGMLLANFLMAYFSQPAHRNETDLSYRDWILNVIENTCDAFDNTFRNLWITERTGMLFPKSLFEDQGQDSSPACDAVLSTIWQDAWSICGIEMLRRCLSLAHNADFEDIADETLRAQLEAQNITMGAELIHTAETIKDVASVCNLARTYSEKDIL